MKEEDIKLLCDKLNFTYVDSSNEPILSIHNKKQTYVRFICNIHQKYGIQEKSLYDLKRLKKPCSYCNHSKLKETFVEEMRNINPTIEILSDYVNWNTKIKCRCLIDGYEWMGMPSTLLYGGGCKICGYRKIWDSRGRKTTEELKRELESINPNIEIIGEYTGSHNLIKCRCKLDGKEWESYVCNLLNNSAGCPECAIRHQREMFSLSEEDIKKRIKDYNLDIELLSSYNNNKDNLLCKCNVHNKEYYVSAKTILYNKNSGCPLCTTSKGENKMISILESMGYDIARQYSFEDCRNVHPLKFDGFDEKRNIAFEYQGQQHYYPVDFSGKGGEDYYNNFIEGLKRDNIKREYCKKNNITLIEVPYWEFDNMETFLKGELGIK